MAALMSGGGGGGGGQAQRPPTEQPVIAVQKDLRDDKARVFTLGASLPRVLSKHPRGSVRASRLIKGANRNILTRLLAILLFMAALSQRAAIVTAFERSS